VNAYDRHRLHATLDELLASKREGRPVELARVPERTWVYAGIDQADARAIAGSRPS